jgi:hypothetical protein
LTGAHDDLEGQADTLAAQLAADVVGRLAGRDATARPPAGAELERVVEQREAGEPGATRLLRLTAQAHALGERLAGARAADNAPVLLADGSRLSLGDAERKLAQKEERRAFAPLREAMELSSADGRERERVGESILRAFASDVGVAERVDEDERARLDAIESALREPALAALAVLSEAPPTDPTSWARALDRPAPEGAPLDVVKALGRALLEAGGARLERPVRMVTAPRALAGTVLSAGADVVRVAVAPAGTVARAARLLDGCGGAALAALDRDEHGLGIAVGVSLASAALRTRVLDEDRQRAQRYARLDAAGRAARAWLTAVGARAACDEDDPDVVAEALASACGCRLPAATLHELARPPWPGTADTPALPRATLLSLEAQLTAAALARGLRDSFDEEWPLRGSFWELLGDAPDELRELVPTAKEALAAFVERLHELL